MMKADRMTRDHKKLCLVPVLLLLAACAPPAEVERFRNSVLTTLMGAILVLAGLSVLLLLYRRMYVPAAIMGCGVAGALLAARYFAIP